MSVMLLRSLLILLGVTSAQLKKGFHELRPGRTMRGNLVIDSPQSRKRGQKPQGNSGFCLRTLASAGFVSVEARILLGSDEARGLWATNMGL